MDFVAPRGITRCGPNTARGQEPEDGTARPVSWGEAVGTKETHTVPREQNPGLVNCTWVGDLSKVSVTSQDPYGSPSEDTGAPRHISPSQSQPVRASVPAATSLSLCRVT